MLANINWDVLGLSKTKLRGKSTTIVKSGSMLFQRNNDTISHLGGVAKRIRSKLKHLVTKVTAVSDRVLKRNNNRTDICSYQCDTGRTKAKGAEKSKYTIINGDFDAKIGPRQDTDPPLIGHFGLGKKRTGTQNMIDLLCKENVCSIEKTAYKKMDLERKKLITKTIKPSMKELVGKTKNTISKYRVSYNQPRLSNI